MIYDDQYMINQINDNCDDFTIESAEDLKDKIIQGLISEKDLIKAFSDLRYKLGEQMKLDSVLFLFGNGASIYAGSKDTRQFQMAELIDKKTGEALSDIISCIQDLGVEEQLNSLIIAQSYFNIINDERAEVVSELVAKIKKALIDNYVNSVDYTRLFYHTMFFQKLRAFGCLSKSRIYTPNYDLAFEYTMDTLRIEYEDGFSGFVNRVFDPRTLARKDRTTLVKIHGSVNWLNSEGSVREYQPRFQNGSLQTKEIDPVLIYPTSGKLYQTYSAPYSELMRRMLDDMTTGHNLIMILGYKYGDDHINEIVMKAMENPNNIYYFFQYDLQENEMIKRVKSLSESMPNINVLIGPTLSSFDNFVRYLLPATPEKTDEEKVFDLLRGVILKDA